jgi:uncharacterized protein (TIGR00369 family)
MTSANNPQQRQHTIYWEDPMIGAQQAQTLSGFDYLSAMIRGEIPASPIGITMQMRPVEIEQGRIVFEANPVEYLYNPIGTMHGGFAATMLDSALGCAVHTTLPAGVAYTTLELHLNYLRPILMSTGTLRAEGKVIHGGKRIATAEARITDTAGKLYAHGTTTCLIMGGE